MVEAEPGVLIAAIYEPEMKKTAAATSAQNTTNVATTSVFSSLQCLGFSASVTGYYPL
jgi:hypothetical protein